MGRLLGQLYRAFSRRSIMTTPRNFEEALETLQKNPFYDKYADRIAQLQKTSPEELQRRVEQQLLAREDEKKKKFAPVDTRQFSSVLNPKETARVEQEVGGARSTGEDRLDDVLKTELVRDKDAAEIRTIWEQYHRGKEAIAAAIPAEQYAALHDNMRRHPTFVLPLPRDHGYEFVLCQSAGHAVHFTPLLAYQVHRENAPECLKMVHYTELAAQGLVLMRGVYDKRVLSGAEARCLADLFQLYYGGRDAARTALLADFTRRPDDFDHTNLIAQIENVSL